MTPKEMQKKIDDGEGLIFTIQFSEMQWVDDDPVRDIFPKEDVRIYISKTEQFVIKDRDDNNRDKKNQGVCEEGESRPD